MILWKTFLLEDVFMGFGCKGFSELTLDWRELAPPNSLLQFWHSPTSSCLGSMKMFPIESRPAQVGLFWCWRSIGKTFWGVWFRLDGPGVFTCLDGKLGKEGRRLERPRVRWVSVVCCGKVRSSWNSGIFLESNADVLYSNKFFLFINKILESHFGF
jgi:hypothetical protein